MFSGTVAMKIIKFMLLHDRSDGAEELDETPVVTRGVGKAVD